MELETRRLLWRCRRGMKELDILLERFAREQYEVRLSADEQDVYWIERRGDTEIRYDSAPDTSIWQRMGAGFLAILPIEWLL